MSFSVFFIQIGTLMNIAMCCLFSPWELDEQFNAPIYSAGTLKKNAMHGRTCF